MKVFIVLKNFFHFFGPEAESGAEGGVPFGVPGAEDVAKGPNKMENNSWEQWKAFMRAIHFFRSLNFFIDKVLESGGSTILAKFRPA